MGAMHRWVALAGWLVCCRGDPAPGPIAEAQGGQGGAAGSSQDSCTFASLCDGAVLTTCKNSQVVKTTCDDAYCTKLGKGHALGCRLGDDDTAFCECGCSDKDSSCSGNFFQYCAPDGAIHPIECSDATCKAAGYKGLGKAGGACQTTADGSGCNCEGSCTAAQNKCKVVSGKDVLTYCDGKALADHPCAEVCQGEAGSVGCGVGDMGSPVCFCGEKKCASSSDNYCTGTTLHYCAEDYGVMYSVPCTDEACKKSGYSKTTGCGPTASGKTLCICE